MSATLLSIVQQASGEMGLAVPSTVIGNTVQDVVQLLYLANGLGNSLSREHPWQAMNKAHTFQTRELSFTANALEGSTVLRNITFANYMALPGESGSYATTPDSATISITGDIDIRAKIAPDDWTPVEINAIACKNLTTGAQRGYQFQVLTSGFLQVITSANGTATVTSTSTAAPAGTAGSALWVRVTVDVDNGAAGNTATFYTSTDGSTWTQLGAAVTNAGTTSIYDNTQPLIIGGNQGGTTQPFAGKIYAVQVYNGIAGTLAANFAANDATQFDSSWTATSTAETWTLAGDAEIVGLSNAYQISGDGIRNATFVATTPDATGSTLALTQAATGDYTASTYTAAQVRYEMPADYDRQIDRTHWDKTQHWEMMGPETAQQWEWLLSGYISTGPRVRYRIFGGFFQIWPMVGADETLGFEYVSTSWVSVTGAGAIDPTKSAFTVDTDTCIFPDRLMVAGIKLRYFEIKGFDTTAFYRDYMMQLDIAKAADAGSPTLSMAPRPTSVLIGFENIPDANYGS